VSAAPFSNCGLRSVLSATAGLEAFGAEPVSDRVEAINAVAFFVDIGLCEVIGVAAGIGGISTGLGLVASSAMALFIERVSGAAVGNAALFDGIGSLPALITGAKANSGLGLG